MRKHQLGDSLLGEFVSNRVTFLIDGFNVYHSIKTAIKHTGIAGLKWLNYHRMCQSFVSDVIHLQGGKLESVYYFTALARHAGADVVIRHKLYIEALKSTGVTTVEGNFKRKFPFCKLCQREYPSHEEKESDVNIALQMIRSFMKDECDTIVLMSGDTDLVSAVHTAKDLFPTKKVGIAFPFKRSNEHFKKVADFTFNISVDGYNRNQFADPIVLPDGKKLAKPPLW